MSNRARAAEPEDLTRLFVELANAGDAEGLAELYEVDAVLAFPPGSETGGRVQVVRRQPDGSWLRVIDRPELRGAEQ